MGRQSRDKPRGKAKRVNGESEKGKGKKAKREKLFCTLSVAFRFPLFPDHC